MFDNFRQALNALLSRSTGPEERRELLSHMRDTLVRAKAGVADLRRGVDDARHKLAAERRELDTVRRRKRMAADVGDSQTVEVAERFELHHAERVQVLEQKVEVQIRELALAESEVQEMTQAFKQAAVGATPTGGTSASHDEVAAREVEDALHGSNGPELDHLARARQRADRDAEADRRLADLKRRMGK